MSKARTLAGTVSTGAVLADGTIDAAEVSGAQPTLVSGTNIKTVNSTSLLGSGDVAVQPTLVSGTSIKTINGTSLLGSGDVAVTGGMTLLATVTPANGVSSVNATGLVSSKQIVVIGSNLTLNTAGTVAIKLSVDNAASFPGLGVSIGSSSVTPTGLVANVYNASISATKRTTAIPAGTASSTEETNATVNAGVVNAIQIYIPGGQTFSGVGTFYIYGIN